MNTAATAQPHPPDIDPWHILEALPDALAILDSAGGVRYANQAWRRLAPQRDDAGQPPNLLSHPEALPDLIADKAAVAQALRGVLLGHQQQVALSAEQAAHHRVTIQAIAGAGERSALIMVRGPDDAAAGGAGRPAIENALRQRAKLFAAMAANLPGILYRAVLNPDGSIVFPYISADERTLTGEASAPPPHGGHWLDRIHADDRAEFLEVLRRSAEQLAPFDLEQRVITVPGQETWVRNITRPHRQDDGTVVWDGMILDITAQKQSERELQASLREKEALLQEVQHRVKNNLQVIASLLDLQALTISDPQAARAFYDSQRRVRAMALVHEQLYQTSTMDRIDFAAYVRTLTEYLLQSYLPAANSVTFKIEIESVYLDANTAIPCGLIISELVANALKHAFPDGRSGEIRISFSQASDDQVTLRVSDTGVGLPPDAALPQKGTLGLKLVSTLARQLHGKVTFERDGGTAVIITFTQR